LATFVVPPPACYTLHSYSSLCASRSPCPFHLSSSVAPTPAVPPAAAAALPPAAAPPLAAAAAAADGLSGEIKLRAASGAEACLLCRRQHGSKQQDSSTATTASSSTRNAQRKAQRQTPLLNLIGSKQQGSSPAARSVSWVGWRSEQAHPSHPSHPSNQVHLRGRAVGCSGAHDPLGALPWRCCRAACRASTAAP